MTDVPTSKTVTDHEAYERWWNAQTLLGDPGRRLWLARDAFYAGMAAARAQVETECRHLPAQAAWCPKCGAQKTSGEPT